jgi:outer membrane lipoprotein carrier protein
LGLKRSESGTLTMVKPGRMKWDYSSPAGKLFLLDGKYAWFYTRGDPQVQRIPAKQLDDLRSPLRFLLGHTELEKELNNLKLTSGANGRFTLTGQPKGQEKRVARLTLTVTADGAITGIEMEESDGALTRFTFTGEQSNAPVPAETFRFTPPAGVPVVDSLPPV